MSRNEVIERLQKNADAIRGMGVTSLFLFGSAARGDARSDSDLD
ncbi:nucleotidyltransferase domain-containing protein, partial [Mesorhizobium sp. USDA-HM6]